MVLNSLLTITCEDVRAHLSEWVDDELEATDRTRLLVHLGACIPCSREATALSAVVTAMHALRARRRGGSVQ